MSRFIGLLGIIAIIGIAVLFSDNRKKINWRLVGIGLALQVIFALIILKVPAGRAFFNLCSKAITKLLDFTLEGSSFLFGSLMDTKTFGSIFALQTLPTIIFFSALMGILYYLGIMQFIVKIIAKGLCKLLGTSGAETLSAVGNIFLGQTEAPLLVKPFIKDMTKSELMAIMVGGMATVAGGVMAGYVAMGVNAGDLLAASIMAAPAGLILAKILVPETEESKTKNTTDIEITQTASNVAGLLVKRASMLHPCRRIRGKAYNRGTNLQRNLPPLLLGERRTDPREAKLCRRTSCRGERLGSLQSRLRKCCKP